MNRVNRFITNIAKKRGLFVGPADNYIPSHIGTEAAGVNVNHSNALSFTGAFSAISTRAENIASLPKSIREVDGKNYKFTKKHPLYKLISVQPNPMMNAFSFWEKNEGDVAGWGNAINIIESNGSGFAKYLWPVEPDNYRILKQNRRLFYEVLTGDFKGIYSAEEILHFKFFTRDGINGIDPITYHAKALGLGIAGQDFAAEYFSKKGVLRGVFELDGELGEETFKRISKRLAAQKNHSTPILEGGLKYKGISISPDAAQVIQSRLFSIQDASRIWKVPVSILAEHTHSTFSNTEQQDIQFVKYGLRPEARRYEKEMMLKLFSDAERPNFDIKFNLEGLLRGDAKTRALVNHTQIMDGYLSRNEARIREKMNPVEGLDPYLVPLNMTTPEALENAIKEDNEQNKK